MDERIREALTLLDDRVVAVEQAAAHLRALLALDEPPTPVPLGLRVTEATADSIRVEWTPSGQLGFTIGRDGTDVHGTGPWSTSALTADANRFRFTSLRPATVYTITLTPAGGVGVSIEAATAPSTLPAPVEGEHGPRALAAGWAARELARDDFNGLAVDLTRWSPYLDPTSQHGNRQPSQLTIVDDPTALGGRALLVTGLPDRRTGGMAHRLNQRFGRWGIRMRADGDYHWHPVPLTWPQEPPQPPAEKWPRGGEIDYTEGKCGVNRVEFFLHYSHDGANHQTSASIEVDTRAWHWWEVEWGPDWVRGWCDGKQWFEDRDRSHFNYPEFGPHHGTIQLDHFGDAKPTGTGRMWVDAYRVYGL